MAVNALMFGLKVNVGSLLCHKSACSGECILSTEGLRGVGGMRNCYRISKLATVLEMLMCCCAVMFAKLKEMKTFNIQPRLIQHTHLLLIVHAVQ